MFDMGLLDSHPEPEQQTLRSLAIQLFMVMLYTSLPLIVI